MGWFTNVMFGKAPEDNQADKVVEQSPEANASGETHDQFHTESGAKVLPEVVVSRVEPHPSSDMKQLELWIELHNRSSLEVEVKRVEILGQSADPGRFLKPNEKYEVKVYRGDTPRQDDHQKSRIQYKVVGNGDYFQSEHMIEYKAETVDNVQWYLPCEMQFVGPVRDI